MPFSQILFLFRIITNTNNTNMLNSCGKEEKSDYTANNLSSVLKKASVSASLEQVLHGSVTVEAVICIPLFLYASICLIWMLELRVLQLKVRSALQEDGKAMTYSLTEVPVLIPAVLEADIIKIIGNDRLANSCIVGGIQCEKSFVRMNTGVMELSARYNVKLPVPQFIVKPLHYEEKMRMKIWNGFYKGDFTDREFETVVYITETGLVYHRDFDCTYLEPSVLCVKASEIDNLRNESGGRYYACCLCLASGKSDVYITNYGTRYHGASTCSRLKRTIYSVPLQEVKGKGACSKCGR